MKFHSQWNPAYWQSFERKIQRANEAGLVVLRKAESLNLQLSTLNPQPTRNANTAVERWDTFERSLSAAQSYANPFQDVQVTATFTHASGKTITVDGFHDGGAVWKIRFLPAELGRWTYATSSTDEGLHGQTGAIECVASTKPYLHGPLMWKMTPEQDRAYIHEFGHS